MLDDSLNKNLESKNDSQHYSAIERSSTGGSGLIETTKEKSSRKVAKAVSSTSSNSVSTSSVKPTVSTDSTKEELEDKSSSSAVRDLVSLTIRRTRQTLKNNWNAKLASFILAVLVWSIISGSQSSIRQLTMQVPLTVLGQVSQSETNPLPKSVEVQLSGPNNRIEDLRISDLRAVLDLRNVSGEFQVNVRVTHPRGVNVESYTPEIIAGNVD